MSTPENPSQPEDKTESKNHDTDPLDTQLQKTNLDLAKAQLRKVNLEIENLKPKGKVATTIVPYIPIITAVLSIAGFLSGVFIYQGQQERDRITRDEDRMSRDKIQYRTSYEQLLQFSSNPSITVQRVLFLRDDIDNLIESVYPPDKRPSEKARLKANIFSLITKECDFTQARHVQLDIAALEQWEDYEKDLKDTPQKTYINKYLRAIQQLHTRDRRYIESVTYSPEIGYREVQAPTDPLSNTFGSLVEGFRLHLKLMGKKERDDAVQEFADVTNNIKLTADLFPPDDGIVLG